jgi:N-acyl homoserine lactone hydrolase
MTCAPRLWRLLTAIHRYDKSLSTRGWGHGHMSLYVEPSRGEPIVLCGDAADLQENPERENAPGLCWKEREDVALASIRKLKRLAAESGAKLWSVHDLAFYRTLPPLRGRR